MEYLQNMRIREKIILSFGIVVVLFAINLVVSLASINAVYGSMSEFYQEQYRVTQNTEEFMGNLQGYGKAISRMAIASEESQSSEVIKNVEDQIADANVFYEDMEQNLAAMETCAIATGGDYLLIKSSMAQLQEITGQMKALFKQGRTQEGLAIFDGSYNTLNSTIQGAADALLADANQQAEEAYNGSGVLFTRLVVVSMVLSLLLIIAAVFLCMALTRVMVKPLNQLETAVDSMAQGNLHFDLPYRSGDEFGALAEAFRHTRDQQLTYINELERCLAAIGQGKLNYVSSVVFPGDFSAIKKSMDQISKSLTTIMIQINTSADQVTEGAQEIAGTGQALSQAVLGQASSVEELAATINDVSDRIQQNAEYAIKANQLTEATADSVEAAAVQMQEMNLAMEKMKQISLKITAIIKEIEDIAFQTNILSLNAAVEAARAGDAGKGFSVVANEIRRLAAKTTEASKSTGDLIGNTVQIVGDNVEMTQEMQNRFGAIVTDTRLVADMVDQISHASNDQADAVIQIRQSIDMISNLVQQNSTTAEESASASEELSGQMEMLRELVETFEYDEQ